MRQPLKDADATSAPGASEAPVDARYYEAAPPGSIGEWLAIRARGQMFTDFMGSCWPGRDSRILDVGVSDVDTASANMFERMLPNASRVTAAGLGEGAAFRRAFPAMTYQRIEPNAPLPFADDSFDIAVSNAVIEHVGSPENQEAFVRELTRVAPVVFITAPNRFFPVEHHTAVPLLHYWPAGFRLACRLLRRTQWLDPQNLILVDRRRLAALAPEGITGYTGLDLGPFSSNLYLVVRRGGA